MKLLSTVAVKKEKRTQNMTHIEETIQKTVKKSRQKNICNSSKNSKIEIITKNLKIQIAISK